MKRQLRGMFSREVAVIAAFPSQSRGAMCAVFGTKPAEATPLRRALCCDGVSAANRYDQYASTTIGIIDPFGGGELKVMPVPPPLMVISSTMKTVYPLPEFPLIVISDEGA